MEELVSVLCRCPAVCNISDLSFETLKTVASQHSQLRLNLGTFVSVPADIVVVVILQIKSLFALVTLHF